MSVRCFMTMLWRVDKYSTHSSPKFTLVIPFSNKRALKVFLNTCMKHILTSIVYPKVMEWKREFVVSQTCVMLRATALVILSSFQSGLTPPTMAVPYRVRRTWDYRWTGDLDDAGGGSGGFLRPIPPTASWLSSRRGGVTEVFLPLHPKAEHWQV